MYGNEGIWDPQMSSYQNLFMNGVLQPQIQLFGPGGPAHPAHAGRAARKGRLLRCSLSAFSHREHERRGKGMGLCSRCGCRAPPLSGAKTCLYESAPSEKSRISALVSMTPPSISATPSSGAFSRASRFGPLRVPGFSPGRRPLFRPSSGFPSACLTDLPRLHARQLPLFGLKHLPDHPAADGAALLSV
jgi:hypothetical protein